MNTGFYDSLLLLSLAIWLLLLLLSLANWLLLTEKKGINKESLKYSIKQVHQEKSHTINTPKYYG
jgi:hypothetical protein